MADMDDKLLQEIKVGLGISSNDEQINATIRQKIEAVKSYLKGGGVSEKMMMDAAAVSTIVIGVNDLWDQEAGEVKFSPVFNLLVGQLKARSMEVSGNG